MKPIYILEKERINKYYVTDVVIVDIVCPRANIQKMLSKLPGKFISKERTSPYGHNAGEIYLVKVQIRLGDILSHLRLADRIKFLTAENYSQFREEAGWGKNVYQLKVTKLYLFGDCGKYIDYKSLNYTPYYNKRGREILLPNKPYNDFGKKRYVCNAGVWYSNKEY